MKKIHFIDEHKESDKYRYEEIKVQLSVCNFPNVQVTFDHTFPEQKEDGSFPDLIGYDILFMHNSFSMDDNSPSIPEPEIQRIKDNNRFTLILFSGSPSPGSDVYERRSVYQNFKKFVSWANDKDKLKINILIYGERHIKEDIIKLKNEISDEIYRDNTNWRKNIPTSKINDLLDEAKYSDEKKQEYWRIFLELEYQHDLVQHIEDLSEEIIQDL